MERLIPTGHPFAGLDIRHPPDTREGDGDGGRIRLFVSTHKDRGVLRDGTFSFPFSTKDRLISTLWTHGLYVSTSARVVTTSR